MAVVMFPSESGPSRTRESTWFIVVGSAEARVTVPGVPSATVCVLCRVPGLGDHRAARYANRWQHPPLP